MPHLVKVQDQFRAQGLIIIASHCQDVPKDTVLGLCRQKHVNYTVVSQGRVQGDTSNGIPHAFLFDASGKCVKEGHPEELTKAIEGLLASEPHWITGGRKLESPAVAKIADALKAGKPFGWALDELSKLEKKEDPKVDKAEVTFLMDQIKAEGEAELAAAKTAEDSDAYGACAAYEDVKTSFKKTEYDKRADERLKELKKDKDFQKELSAGKLIAQINDLCGKLVAQNGKVDLDYTANRDTAANIAAGAKKLKKDFGDTKAAKKCLSDLGSYGFKL